MRDCSLTAGGKQLGESNSLSLPPWPKDGDSSSLSTVITAFLGPTGGVSALPEGLLDAGIMRLFVRGFPLVDLLLVVVTVFEGELTAVVNLPLLLLVGDTIFGLVALTTFQETSLLLDCNLLDIYRPIKL